MKMVLCAACAKNLGGKNPENHKKDKCQCCGGWRCGMQVHPPAGGMTEGEVVHNGREGHEKEADFQRYPAQR